MLTASAIYTFRKIKAFVFHYWSLFLGLLIIVGIMVFSRKKNPDLGILIEGLRSTYDRERRQIEAAYQRDMERRNEIDIKGKEKLEEANQRHDQKEKSLDDEKEASKEELEEQGPNEVTSRLSDLTGFKEV